MTESLTFEPALSRPELLAPVVANALVRCQDAAWIDEVEVAEIDPASAGGAEVCARYGISVSEAGNCILIEARRGVNVQTGACVTPPGTRTDLGGVVRRYFQARTVSLLPQDKAVAQTGMEHGSITPVGLPKDWHVLVDPMLAEASRLVIGSGILRAKLRLPGPALLALTGGVAVEHLVRS